MRIKASWIAMLTLVSQCAAQEPTQTDIAQQIRQQPSSGRAEALGGKWLEESRTAAAAAAVVWRTGDAAERRKARLVLNEMEEAALPPLLKTEGDLDPDEQIWRLTMVVETLGELRKSAAVMLDHQLSNKQPAPLPSIPGAEGKPPARRVCDEAYVLMSRLATAGPLSEAVLSKMRQFQRLPESERDAKIQRARQTTAWRSLLR